MALLHWWPLNKQNDFIDIASKNTNLVNHGAIFESSGKLGTYALKVLGTSSGYLDYGKRCCDEFTNNSSFTICLWFKTSARPTTNGTGIYANNQYNNGGGFGLTINTDGRFGLFLNNTSSAQNQYVSNKSIPLNEWHHIAVTYNNTTGRYNFYFDGDDNGSGNGANWTTNTTTTFIGQGTQGGWSYGGTHYINDLRIYNNALSKEKIKEISLGKVAHYLLNKNATDISIPSDYQTVEYIESDGTQYILQSMETNINTRIECIYKPNTTNQQAIFGSRNNDGSGISFWTDGYMHFGSNSSRTGSGYTDINQHYVKMSYDLVTVNDVVQLCNKGTQFGSTTVVIFSTNNGSTIDPRMFNGKVYDFKIYDDNRLAFHGIPCYRKADGKPGMWDSVSNTFKINNGSGDFLLGPSIGLPNEYQQLEYIESTNEQLILINHNVSVSDKYDMIYQLTKPDADMRLFGNYGSGWGYSVGILGKKYRDMANFNNINIATNTNINRMICQSTTIKINNESATYTAPRASTSQFALFGSYYNNTNRYFGSLKIYSFRIFNSSFVRDLVPCYRKSDNKPGMFDLIQQVFYTNVQTGNDFIAGAKLHLSNNLTKIRKTNQLFNFNNGSKYSSVNKGITLEYNQSSRIYYAHGTTEDWSGKYCTFYPFFDSAFKNSIANHKYAFVMKTISASSNKMCLSGLQGVTATNVYNDINQIKIFNVTDSAEMRPYVNTDSWAANKTYDHKFKLAFVDLTDICGSGNEPTNLDQVKIKCPWILECEDFAPLGTIKPEAFRNITSNSNSLEYDISGNNYHLSVYNNANKYTENSVRYNSSYICEGAANKYLYNTQVPQMQPPFTVSCWVKLDNYSGHQWIFNYAKDNTPYGWGFYIYNNKICFGINGIPIGTIGINLTTLRPAYNEWHLLTATYDGSVIKFYIDGIMRYDQNKTGTLTYTDCSALLIGKMSYNYTSTSSYYPYSGLISDARIYATALSAEDIEKLYKSGNY